MEKFFVGSFVFILVLPSIILAMFGFFMDWSYFKSFNIRDFFGGNFQENFNYYFKNRIPIYSKLTFLKSNLDILTGQNVSNGVLINGKELIKITKWSNDDKDNIFLLHLEKFCPNINKPIYFLFITSKLYLEDSPLKFRNEPSSINHIEDSLKKDFPTVNFLDNNILFENSKEFNVYYRTSDRINAYGAYLLYFSNMKKLGQSPIDMEYFNIHHVVEDYYGELYSKNFFKKINPDTIDIFKYYKKDINVDVEEICKNGDILKRNTIYDLSRIYDYDKVHIVFGGEAVIKNVETNLEGKEKILIFSDENIDNFMQFLPLHYKNITVVNLHNIFDAIHNDIVLKKINEIKTNSFDKIFFIYGINSLNDDEQFRNLKYFTN